MQRLATVLMSCLLVAGATHLTTAQETLSEPPWWQGDRAEMAEHGFALTIPGGWVGFDLTGDLEEQVDTIASDLGMADEVAQGFLESLREIRGGGTQILLSTDDANCELQVGPGESEALVWQRYEVASDDEDILDIDRPRPVALPSGSAHHMSWTNDTGNPYLSMYSGQQQDLAYEIKCSGQSRPEDDWLHVAEGFEWLVGRSADPDTGTSDPSPASADLTVPPAGPPFPDRIVGTAVYDHAGVFGPFAVGATEQVIREVEEASGAQIVVYTQVKPESDTFAEAEADAAALMTQWGVGPDGLVIFFDLDPGLCYGQVQLYADAGYSARHLSIAERQALFEEEIIPPLDECDFDTALLGAMSRLGATAGAVASTGAAASSMDADEVVTPRPARRVEMADLGFALSLPDGWTAFEIGGDLEAQVNMAVAGIGGVSEPMALDLLERLQATRGQYDLVAMDLESIDSGDPSKTQVCNVGTAGSLGDFTLDALAPAVAAEIDGMQSVEVTRGPEAVDLPSGRAYVIDFTQPGPDNLEASVPTAIYLVANDVTFRAIDCLGPTAPADDWLSILETWEWLPVDTEAGVPSLTTAPISFGGRIEVPEQGYALTAPDDWTSIRPTAGQADSIIETLKPIDPDLAATAEAVLAGDAAFSLVAFGAYDTETGFRENCNVIDYPSTGDPVGVAIADGASAIGGIDNLATGPETALLDLPVGEVGRLDYGLQYPDFQTAHAAYYFVDEATVHILTCTDVKRPVDDWLSIAQSFESLTGAGTVPG